jgi:hypothetical protein
MLVGPIGKEVRIGEGRGANGRRHTTSWPGGKRKCKREKEVKGIGPYQGLGGGVDLNGVWITGHKVWVDMMKRLQKGMYEEEVEEMS